MIALRTLLVDDDADTARRLAMVLEPALGPVTAVPDVHQALARHADEPFDLVILEIALPGASGIDLLERLAPAAPAVVLTWLVSPAITARARAAGAHSVLLKPSRVPDLVSAAHAAVRSMTPPALAVAR